MMPLCPRCPSPDKLTEGRILALRFGQYRRKSDQALVLRFRCQLCLKTYSTATRDPCFRQKKRQFNALVADLLVSGVSQRRMAILLKLNRKTVVRKFIYMGEIAQKSLYQNQYELPKVSTLEFDDLETFEHTKCKPLSVTLAVEYKSRRFLGFQVSKMPAKGKLAHIALKKYGPRKDERPLGRNRLFKEIEPFVQRGALIKSDDNPHYVKDVEIQFPNSLHKTFKGRRGCIVGQGELKKIGFDPLFSLNHTCAQLRADINRLFRRTWCTTKLPERLAYHIALAAVFHNSRFYN